MFAKNDHFHQEGMFTKQIAEVFIDKYRIILQFTDYMKSSIDFTNWTKAKTKEEFTLKRNLLIL